MTAAPTAAGGEPRIAIVQDWLDTWGGGENVLAEIVGAYPSADLYALVDFLPDDLRRRLAGKRARTTFLQRMPGARRHFRMLLPLFPRAIESLDLSGYDLVISSSHAVAKGVRTSPDQLHVCYCHTPMRYAWDLRAQYLGVRGLDKGFAGLAVNALLDRLRDWDRRTSTRVTEFATNSAYVRERIARCYGRGATVIAPPVDTVFFTPAPRPIPIAERGYFFAASRFVPYKRLDLVAAAFRALPDARLVLAGDGPEAARIRSAAGPNVEFPGHVTRERMRDLLRGARAFVFAAEEDFGILPVEAQACGTPVIAYGRGGALETVRATDDATATGLFFAEQTAESLRDAVARFDARSGAFAAGACRANAQPYGTARFVAQFTAFVDDAKRRKTRAGR